MKDIQVAEKIIGLNHPTYFIADIAANHDGDLSRAIDLIHLAAEAGSDAVKFQHFNAKDIVSDYGFKDLQSQLSHQASWKKSVYETYEDASLPREWTEDLQKASNEAGVHFFSAPYDLEAISLLNNLNVPAHKIGSGDVTWSGIIKQMSKKGLPIFIATGASDMNDVKRAMKVLQEQNAPICLMQCNTNYTGDHDNLRHINLNVLKTFSRVWPDVVLGLSDHTPGHATVLGAVALGARAVEKHFTDNKMKDGPDHAFSMDSVDWKEMVNRTRELESALGSEEKFIAENEKQTVILQRRCVRLTVDLLAGDILSEKNLEVLRPAPLEAIMPYDFDKVLGKRLKVDKVRGQHLTLDEIE
jgi:N-acetylneuraminate synthase